MMAVAAEKVSAEGRFILRGIDLISRQQLLTGEIASYLPAAQGASYQPYPLISALVYDALAVFDPGSPWFDPRANHFLPAASARAVAKTVRAIRSRIRMFLAWQEGADGRWRLFGCDGESNPDLATTACAATILSGSPRRRRMFTRTDRHAAILNMWVGAAESIWLQHCAQAYALRYLAIIGADYTEKVEFVLQCAAQLAKCESTCPMQRIGFIHAASRAWYQGALPNLSRLRSAVLPALVEMACDTSDLSLFRALSTAALLDLESYEHLKPFSDELFERSFHVDSVEPYCGAGTGSVAVNAALHVSNLVRMQGVAEGNL